MKNYYWASVQSESDDHSQTVHLSNEVNDDDYDGYEGANALCGQKVLEVDLFEVEASHANDKRGIFFIGGNITHFHCEECHTRFMADPSKYLTTKGE